MKRSKVRKDPWPVVFHSAWLGGGSLVLASFEALGGGDAAWLAAAPVAAAAGVLLDRAARRQTSVGREGLWRLKRADKSLDKIEALARDPLVSDGALSASAAEALALREALVRAAHSLERDVAKGALSKKEALPRWRELDKHVATLKDASAGALALIEERRELNRATGMLETSELELERAARVLQEGTNRVSEEIHTTRDTRYEFEGARREVEAEIIEVRAALKPKAPAEETS